MLRSFVVAGIALMLVGCRPQAPQLNYQSVALTPISFQEVKATIKGTISNDNMFPLSGSIAYSLKLADRDFFSGSSKEFSVGSQQTAPFSLETTINLTQAYGSLKELLAKISQGETEVPFSIAGEYASQSLLGMPLKAPLRAEGKIPLPKLPKIKLTNISVKSISLTAVTLQISAQVINENSIPINIQKFAYQLVGNNKEIVSSSFTGDTNIAANSKENINWDATLNLQGLDSSLVKRLLDGSLQTELKQGIENIQ